MPSPFLNAFHTVGIPGIFVRSDILADLDRKIWSFGERAAAIDRNGPPVERNIILHEIRHFHDALLSPVLINRYLYETQQHHIAVLAISYLLKSGARMIDEASLPQQYREWLEFHRVTQKEYESEYSSYKKEVYVETLSECINYQDLLEASSTITEIFWLKMRKSDQAMQAFCDYCLARLPRKYSWWLRFLEMDPTRMERNLRTIYRGIQLSVYGIDHPVHKFRQLAASGLLRADIDPHEAIPDDEIIAEMEAAAGQDNNKPVLQLFDGTADPESKGFRPICVADLLAVKSRVAKWIMETRFDAISYLEDQSRIVAPPIFFYADDVQLSHKEAPFARRADLTKYYGELFLLHEDRDRLYRTVVDCGIVPAPGYSSFIECRQLDSLLSFKYFSQRLFGERVSFCPSCDEVYERILTKYGEISL